MFEFVENSLGGAKIKVIGVGGGGGNAVDNMIEMGLAGVDFICANTDAQALAASKASLKMQLGAKLTKGLGAGSNPDVGKRAAEEDRDKIRECLEGAHMVFITAGMGGGTGTGGAPVCAEIAKEVGALSVAVVTKPFSFENKKRMEQAEDGIIELAKHVDTLLCIPNQKLLEVAGKDVTLVTAFKRADEILYFAVKGISDLITVRGLINLDFSDIRTVMEETGMAIMGTGKAEGNNKGVEAAKRAVTSPLLEELSIHGARGVLVNLTGGENLTLEDVEGAMIYIQNEVHPEAHIIFGAVIDKMMGDELMVTVIATGFSKADGSLSRELIKIGPAAVIGQSKSDLDMPTFIRKERDAIAIDKVTRKNLSVNGEDSEYDIPTFLRKKAD
ncbi:MAG: cell division protein FtsZ [Deltaproteobacteria bacterium]|nr:cell division protein FtsZ [Candidatus Zymogenaceae bacterium]